jgi:type IV pilus assembly protein PilC
LGVNSETAKVSPRWRRQNGGRGKADDHQISLFFRAFSVLIRSGVSLPHTFELLNADLVGKRLGRASADISLRIQKGASLHQAMREQGLFSPLQINLLKLAFETGSFVSSLEALARYAEKQSVLRRRLTTALTYPSFLLVGCLLFVTIVPAALFKDLFQLLEGTDQALPWYTEVVLVFSKSLGNPVVWFVTLSGLVVATTLVRAWYLKPQNRLKAHALGESIPWLGGVLKNARIHRFAEALYVVVRSGQRIDRGLELACDASGSPLLKEAAPALKEGIAKGMTLSETLEASELFPRLLIESLRTGEEVGELDTMCLFVANISSSELEHSLERFATIMEPFALLLMGGIVGFLAISCIQPLSASLSSL